MNYAVKQRTTHATLLKKGALATLAWDEKGVGDKLAGTVGTPLTRTRSVPLVVLPLSRRFLAADTYEAQTLILQRSRRFLMGAYQIDCTPTQGMRIVGWEGHNWTIDSIAPLIPDGQTVVMYTGTMKQ